MSSWRNPPSGFTAVVLLALGLASLAFGEPVVIEDRSPTRPIGDYLPADRPKRVPAVKAPPSSLRRPAPRFPIRTPGLQPGAVAPRTLNLPSFATSTPFFVLGGDSYSRAWLRQHHDRLRRLGAVGLVVQAETVQDFEDLQALAGDLPLGAANASELVQTLGLTHYPALIAGGRIEP
jgi:integrating conjugative element protein (TIGR03765 family)